MKFNLRKLSLALFFLILMFGKTVTASTQSLEQDTPKSTKPEKTTPSEDDSPNANSDDRTAKEFREYIAGKLSYLTDEQLDSIVAKADANNDGKISDEEFDNRIAVIQSILSGEKNDSKKEPKSDSDSPAPSTENKPVIIEPLTPSTDATVLLITADELAKSWVPFAKWKTQNGKLTKIVTVAQIAEEFEADKKFGCVFESISTITKLVGLFWVEIACRETRGEYRAATTQFIGKNLKAFQQISST